MTKLKTLKDIDNDKTYDKGNGIVSVERLKQEAIKWVKGLKSIKKSIMSQDYRDGKIDVLISFFNISDEDLKWKKNLI